MEPTDPREAEESEKTLRQLEERLRRDATEMVKVLRTDVPAFILRTVKHVFEETENADGLADADVKRLKQDTQATCDALAREIGDRLNPIDPWLWPTDQALPADPKGLEENPRLGEVLARIPAALADLLERNKLPARALGERGRYKLPTYFVAGHFMKSLVESYWRTVAAHHELSEKIYQASQRGRRQDRRSRWEKA